MLQARGNTCRHTQRTFKMQPCSNFVSSLEYAPLRSSTLVMNAEAVQTGHAMKSAGDCDVGPVRNVSSKRSAAKPTPRARHGAPPGDCHRWITSSFYLHENH